jgi:alpha-glucoside transport system substrate-binding protein
MLRRRANRFAVLAVAVALVGAACSPEVSEDRVTIEVFGPYRGEEAIRFAASFAPFEEETGIDVRYVGTGSFAADIQTRITEAAFPDVALFPQPALIAQAIASGALATLPDSIVENSRGVGDSVLSTYAVWFRASAKSLVWYPPKVFEENGYTIPTTWDELMALSETMVDDGVAPWCLSIESFASTGWVGTDWIEDIVLRQQGFDFYDEWVAGDILFESSEIRNTFSTFGEIVHGTNTVLGGTNRILNTPWQDAAAPMFEDPPRCLMQKAASFWSPNIPSGVTFGEDIDFFVLPGITDSPPPVLVAGEMAAAFNDRPEVAAFMEFLNTPESGEGWAELGGFISPDDDFDESTYGSPIDRKVGQTIENAPFVRFDGSDQMPAVVGTGTFWQAMRIYIRSGDIARAVTLVDESWPRAAQLPADG